MGAEDGDDDDDNFLSRLADKIRFWGRPSDSQDDGPAPPASADGDGALGEAGDESDDSFAWDDDE